MGLIRDWLSGRAALLRWLDFEDYARQVFGNDHPAWYREPMRYVAGLADANKVLGSQVVSFDFGAVLGTYAAHAQGEQGASRLAAVLGAAEVNAFCNDAIAALCHQHSGRADVVLKLPSPAQLLVNLGESATDIDFDMLDDMATALADLLRGFAGQPIAGLLLEFADIGADLAEECEACEVLQSVAGHYDWVFALTVADDEVAEQLGELSADLILSADCGLADAGDGAVTGGRLDAEFWQNGLCEVIGRACLYGRVPPNADPKIIVERVASLP